MARGDEAEWVSSNKHSCLETGSGIGRKGTRKWVPSRRGVGYVLASERKRALANPNVVVAGNPFCHWDWSRRCTCRRTLKMEKKQKQKID